MKKVLMLAAVAACLSAPAFAATTHAHKGGSMAEQCMTKADTDNDKMISKDEWNTYGASMFDEADTNKDGKLSMDELKAMDAKKHAAKKSTHSKKVNGTVKTDNSVTKTDAAPAAAPVAEAPVAAPAAETPAGETPAVPVEAPATAPADGK